ncbi:hypothetical protein H5410_060771 [Solanum commersonii]|uniref:Uncharacterized protein n=1 Tax=Solanum commersonii TaxID=4109 RepID=A0A9J5W5Z0_SOLCO|nr:hypothetical protein H5410_060771 [Solanum commersonii]
MVFKNLCCEGPLIAVSQDRRVSRQSALWSGSSSFSLSLQHLCIVIHWVTGNCLTKLLSDAATSPFPRILDLFL